MSPLDLTVRPPRGPRERLDGLMFLPRTIDKVRATLPGGTPGEYRIEGLTRSLLEVLDIPLEAFTDAVAAAGDETEIAAYVRGKAAPEAYERWNAWIAVREPRGGNRAEALTVYPWLAERPDVILVLDVLAEDDRLAFAASR